MVLGRPAHPVITYGTYPVLVLIGGVLAALALAGILPPSMVAGVWMLIPALILVVLEWRYPLRSEWRMTKRTFWRRDVKFVLLFVLANLLARPVSTAIVVRIMPVEGAGVLAGWPLALQVVAALLLFDLLWYTWHRAAHQHAGLWRAHAAHHAAPQLYVVMHLLFHPIDIVVILALQIIAFQLTGISALAVMLVLMIDGLQGVVSHTNLDLRFGPVNYVLMTTELHRYHHSAIPEDAGNFGTATPIWDHVFGTFVYHPERVPARLGLTDPATYPNPERFHAVLAWPFERPTTLAEA